MRQGGSVEIRVLGSGDDGVLRKVAPDVFDYAVRPELAVEFLSDPRHHLVVAVDDGTVVGMASAVDYIHPDKPTELWINEVAVAPTHRNRGIGKQLVRALFEVGKSLGCQEAWVLTENDNDRAKRLYGALAGVPSQPVAFTFKLSPKQERATSWRGTKQT